MAINGPNEFIICIIALDLLVCVYLLRDLRSVLSILILLTVDMRIVLIAGKDIDNRDDKIQYQQFY